MEKPGPFRLDCAGCIVLENLLELIGSDAVVWAFFNV